MASMFRNPSLHSLMGFSVHQPAIGAPLQFFPAMGSKQLDEMINAYVPGNASILDKRAAVSVEFFEHTMATGELFKFFMVYPDLGTAVESPASSSASGYGSSLNTSPVISESQWTQTSSASLSPSHKARASSSKKAVATTSDFSHIPGMKIMTKDGRDVTNSASRGCKTKEQRDHAHLMRIIKACDACRKKKIRCDPSHKRRVASSPEAKVTKKAKVARPTAAPPQRAVEETSLTSLFDPVIPGLTSSFDYSFPELTTDSVPMEWDQFIQYDEELTEPVPYDYDFFSDPAGFFSPATSATNTSYTSPSQPITPVLTTDSDTGTAPVIARTGEEAQPQAPTLPYLNPGGLEAGNNYIDFNLYSPGSSVCLDDDPSLVKEVAASPGPDRSVYLTTGSSQVDCYRHRHRQPSPDQEGSTHQSALESATHGGYSISSPQNEVISTVFDEYSHYDRSDYRPDSSPYVVNAYASTEGISSSDLHDLEHYNGLHASIQDAPNILQSELSSGSTQSRLSTPPNELGGGRSGANHGEDPHSRQRTSPVALGLSSNRPSVPQSGSSASLTEANLHQHDLHRGRSTYAPQDLNSKGSNSGISVDVGTSSTTPRNPTRPLGSSPVDNASITSALTAGRTIVYYTGQDTTPVRNHVREHTILSLIAARGSSPQPPLPSPDRPPVISVAYNDRAASTARSTHESAQTHAALDTTRASGSTSYATPRPAIAVAPWNAVGHSGEEVRGLTTDATRVCLSGTSKGLSHSVSALSGVTGTALERSSGQSPSAKRSGCSSSDNNSLMQRLVGSCLSWILAAVGACCSLYALSSVLGMLPIFVAVACVKLLQHSAPCVDKDVYAQPLSVTRQPCVAITDSVKRKYVALQSGFSIPVRHSITSWLSSRPRS
ncbi:hypothetical protein F5X99DRAFT_393646 [Biscogniauxia marginata]|nr:hypothetical protein F5X99DRAFT_393646 [Biscogniauxia marginata]